MSQRRMRSILSRWRIRSILPSNCLQLHLYLENRIPKNLKSIKSLQKRDITRHPGKKTKKKIWRRTKRNARFAKFSSEESIRFCESEWILQTEKQTLKNNLWEQRPRPNVTLDVRLSKKERRVDALALRADERRDKLRKATGRSKYPLIRRYLNGETCMRNPHATYDESIVIRREPGELKHLSSRRKRKKTRFPK